MQNFKKEWRKFQSLAWFWNASVPRVKVLQLEQAEVYTELGYPAGTGLAPGSKLQTCEHLFATKYGYATEGAKTKKKKKTIVKVKLGTS